jgi:hypothetical protein
MPRGHQRDTNHCEDGYHELPSVSQRPVVQPSQERLVLAGSEYEVNSVEAWPHCDADHEG